MALVATDWEAVIRTALLADSRVTALVQQRIHHGERVPLRGDSRRKPVAMIQLRALGGLLKSEEKNAPGPYQQAQLDVVCYGRDANEARAVDLAVYTVLGQWTHRRPIGVIAAAGGAYDVPYGDNPNEVPYGAGRYRRYKVHYEEFLEED